MILLRSMSSSAASASSSSFIPEFYRDGQKLELFNDPSGVKMGKIQFTASAGNYDPRTLLARKTYKAEIKLPDTTLTEDVEYFVAQPVIKVTTGNAPTLYRNCGNTVNIEVPSLGTDYNPSFNARGAEIIKGDKIALVGPNGIGKSTMLLQAGDQIGR